MFHRQTKRVQRKKKKNQPILLCVKKRHAPQPKTKHESIVNKVRKSKEIPSYRFKIEASCCLISSLELLKWNGLWIFRKKQGNRPFVNKFIEFATEVSEIKQKRIHNKYPKAWREPNVDDDKLATEKKELK